ncbi:MAG: FAD-dependent oxidoreductase [Clostridia bacterium]|nr:FAD-dependent oxidoreductase [Clostridia bacterium]
MKKGTIITSILLIAAMLLCGAGAFAAEGTSSAQGFGGEVTVNVVVEDGVITQVIAEGASETTGVGSNAIEQLPARIVEAQSVAIDGVAGATITSTAVLTAAKDALISAGMSEEDVTREVEAAAIDTTPIELTADVVVVGAGGAGMSAAVEASNHGASVIVIEKMPSIGGNTLVAGSAMNASQPTIQATQTMPADRIATVEALLALEPQHELMEVWQAEVSRELEAYKESGDNFLFDSAAFHKLQTYVGGDYVGNPELISMLCDKAIEGVYWLENLGATWKDEIVSVYGSTWTRGHNPTMDMGTAGASFVYPQYNRLIENGGTVLLNHRADELMTQDGSVVGVKGQTSDGVPFTVHANKGVVLATGGFSANEELREMYNEQWPTLMGLDTTNPPSSTGDGIIMAEAIDANLVGMGWIQLIPYSSNSLTATIDGSLYLDKDGKRFIAEDERRDVIAAATIDHNDGWFWWLVDRKTIIDELDGVSIYGKVIADMDNGVDVFYGDTLEDIAERAGMDYATLQETVDAYNASVASGVDPIGRQNMPQTIDEGPYCMFVDWIMVHHTMGGVQIDDNCQVYDVNGNVIPGLYAAGEVTGGIHGSNRLGGNAITDVVVFGRIAGTSAAAR